VRRVEMIQSNYEIVIMNYDGLPLVADEIIKDGRFDLVIVDEANAVKSASTRRWKTLNRILRPDTYLWMMTGTPAAQSPLDAYGLAKLVNPQSVPFSFTGWRDKVMNKVTMFKWVPKPDAKQTVYKALQPSIRFTKDQCLDLPPVVFQTREVDMTAQQMKYYKLLKEQLLVQAAGETISAVNAAAGLNKLLQISSGAAYSDDREVVEFDCTPRLNVLLEILEETDRKVLIFCMFRSIMDTIFDFLKARGQVVEQIHGDVTATKRADIINRFQTQPEPRVLVMQPQATAHGITLTAADTVVFYGPLMSVEQYWQAIARTDRKGQDSDKVRVIHIESSPVEKKMFKALQEKVGEHLLLTSMFDHEVRGK
jgi:SNF2 family DNA or RNA helicase